MLTKNEQEELMESAQKLAAEQVTQKEEQKRKIEELAQEEKAVEALKKVRKKLVSGN